MSAGVRPRWRRRSRSSVRRPVGATSTSVRLVPSIRVTPQNATLPWSVPSEKPCRSMSILVTAASDVSSLPAGGQVARHDTASQECEQGRLTRGLGRRRSLWQTRGPMIEYDGSTALVVVDVQNDFADRKGSLYVRGGEEILALVNGQIEAGRRRRRRGGVMSGPGAPSAAGRRERA